MILMVMDYWHLRFYWFLNLTFMVDWFQFFIQRTLSFINSQFSSTLSNFKLRLVGLL